MRSPLAASIALALVISATPAAAAPRLFGIPTHVPAGGRLHVRWVGLGREVQEVEIEVSLGGGRWLRISPEMEAREGGFAWDVPAGFSGPVRLRLCGGGEGFEAAAEAAASFTIECPLAAASPQPALDAWWRVAAHTVPAASRALAGTASLSALQHTFAIAPEPRYSARVTECGASTGRVSVTARANAAPARPRRAPSRRQPLRI